MAIEDDDSVSELLRDRFRLSTICITEAEEGGRFVGYSIQFEISCYSHASAYPIVPETTGIDYQTFYHVLQSCKHSLDYRTAIKTHAKLIVFGYGTYSTLLTSLLSVYVQCDILNLACQLVEQIFHCAYDLVSLNLVIQSFMMVGKCDIAEHVFDKMCIRDVVTWNSMISGFVRNAQCEEALRLFQGMLNSNVEADEFTFASVITSCGRLGALNYGQRVHHVMMEKNTELNFILSSALIDMYSRCGRIQVAVEIFDSVQRNNVCVWNAMINGLAMHGLAFDAITIFSKMDLENVLPDPITFVSLLMACSHCGLVEQGRNYFDLMTSRYSIQPQLEHYGAMVDLLGRAGLLEEAFSVISAMPIEPDVVMWRSFLSACRIYRKLELGEVAIANVCHPRSGDYVLISNIYCSLRRWDSVEGVREVMKKKGVRKKNGKSWLELMGVIHQFKAGDRSHPEMKEIHRVLEGLNHMVKLKGFNPMTDLVLMDVSEEEKEENLNCHSEKLALAYGILKTSPGIEIRISKNLRICYDCHCWIKIVSKIISRVIIVRDRVRFHHFEGGICSCGDYW
ncbi:hypothetical protein FNV43_RR17046 [Rhamnella rubrinervis]|uniref:DYW domain-containing protein n=1 Tax=Rhamnella rubrinervis TaxID=2594499 RepID=A0A8K0GZY9_9ROSA|nr:hypothetical protein FNV43_RR17046 [Rhamnella rubrinervis]